MKIIFSIITFLISIYCFAQSKDSIVFEPKFQIGKTYLFNIQIKKDLEFKNPNEKKVNTSVENKMTAELQFKQKIGKDYIFRWRITENEITHYQSNYKPKKRDVNLPKETLDLRNLDLLLKINEDGSYGGILNSDQIKKILITRMNNFFAEKSHKTKNESIFFENYKNNLDNNLQDAGKYFVLYFNNFSTPIYKGKSTVKNSRRGGSTYQSFPMENAIQFKEGDKTFLLEINKIFDQANFNETDFKSSTKSFFYKDINEFLKNYTYTAQEKYVIDKQTHLIKEIEISSIWSEKKPQILEKKLIKLVLLN